MVVANHSCICEKPLQRYSNNDEEIHNYNCPQRRALGLLCHKHFETPNRKQWEVDECPDCQKAIKENAERIQMTQTIDPTVPYTSKVVLTCKDHPNLRWSTKNISYIGARTIFFDGDITHDHQKDPTYIPHRFLKDDVHGPHWMETPCSMRQSMYGELIWDTELDCECSCGTRNLVLLSKV